MTATHDSPDLEAALIERAERLAAEYVGRGRDSSAAIVREKRQRLRDREERMSEEASANADRSYRRRVQAAELRLQGDLDRRRWALIQSVFEELPTRLAALSRQDGYDELLMALLTGALASIDADEPPLAALNHHDLERLGDRWEEFCEQTTDGHTPRLDSQPLRCSGGVQVTGAQGRVRINNTFEGRIERFRNELTNAIAEKLFAHDPGQVG